MSFFLLAAVPTSVWVGLATLAFGLAIWQALTLRRRWNRSRFAEYGYDVRTFNLAKEGAVEYAQWLHPKEQPKIISQDDVNAARRYVSPGDLVIDIGAHTGAVSLPFALAAGPQGTLLAFEPNPYVFKILSKNATLNRGKLNVIAHNFAATDKDGTFEFHYSDGAFCNGGFLDKLQDRRHGHRQPLKVQGRNLERFLRREYGDRLKRLAFVKVDTEGYDRQVIESIMGILREYSPVIMCEVYKRLTKAEREHQFDVLAAAGYQCYLYVGGAKLIGGRIERKDLLCQPHYDMIALPRRMHISAAA